MNKIILPLLFGLFTSTFALAENDHKQMLTSVIQKLNQVDSENWAFKQILTNEEGMQISHFDPHKAMNSRWSLASVDNISPNEEQLEDFNDLMNTVAAEKSRKEKKTNFAEMISADTLALLKVEGNFAHFSFTPLIKDMHDEKDKLQGELIINVVNQQASQILVKNIDDVSPAFSVSLDKLNLTFDFSSVESRTVLSKITMDMSGTVGFFKSIAQNSTQELLDYQYMGEVQTETEE